ncbi:hypothetical protein [Guyparkeria sp. TX1]|uniref:hypothetical protein n=1 Tax=Guyparkeria sp. TX1 TaxID=3115001 RepID=UPI00397734BD
MRGKHLLLSLESRGWFVFSGLFLWAMLDFGYRIYVSPVHAYSGFGYEPAWVKYFEGLLLFVLLLILAPRCLARPSDYFMNFLLFGLMAPLLIFYGLADQSREHLYIVLLGYVIIDAIRRGALIRFPLLKEGPFIAYVGLGVGAGLVTIWLIVSGGVAYLNLDLSEVYEYRRDVGAVINQGFMGYANTWAYKIFGPALLAIALWKRVYWLAALVFALHVFWFGVSAHKSVLFFPFLVLFLWVWFRKTRALSVVPIAMSGVVVATLLLYVLFDSGYPASLFVRRVFFVVADNTFDYYSFFSVNQHVYWSNSILSSLVEYPYHIGYPELIGEARGTESHVNNTFLSTGFMHAGVLGIIFYSVLAGFLFKLIDSVSAQGIPVWVAVAVLIVPSRSLLLSADLPTALLTHGIGVGFLSLFLLRSKRTEIETGVLVNNRHGARMLCNFKRKASC